MNNVVPSNTLLGEDFRDKVTVRKLFPEQSPLCQVVDVMTGSVRRAEVPLAVEEGGQRSKEYTATIRWSRSRRKSRRLQ